MTEQEEMKVLRVTRRQTDMTDDDCGLREGARVLCKSTTGNHKERNPI